MQTIVVILPIVAVIAIIAVLIALWRFGYFSTAFPRNSRAKLEENRLSTASIASNSPFRSDPGIPPVPTVDRKYISTSGDSFASSGTLAYSTYRSPDLNGPYKPEASTLNLKSKPSIGNMEFEASRHSVVTAASQNTMNYPPRKMSRDTGTLTHVRSNSTSTLHTLHQGENKDSSKGQPTYEEIKLLHQRGHEAWKFSLEEDDSGMAFTGMTTSGNGFIVKYGPNKQGERSCLSNLPLHRDPLNPHRAFYYFEITVKELDPDSIVAIGLATKPYPPDLMLGRDNYSIAILSDDGSILRDGAKSRTAFSNAFDVNTTIGCGYDSSLGNIFYTMNGEWIGNAATNEPVKPYHAAVSANGPSVLMINVGQHPFKFESANPPQAEQQEPGNPKISERGSSRGRTPKQTPATVPDAQQPDSQNTESAQVQIRERGSSRNRTPKLQAADALSRQTNTNAVQPDLQHKEYIPTASFVNYDNQDRQPYQIRQPPSPDNKAQYQQIETQYQPQSNYHSQSRRPSDKQPPNQPQQFTSYPNPGQPRRSSGHDVQATQIRRPSEPSYLSQSRRPSGPDQQNTVSSQSRRPSDFHISMYASNPRPSNFDTLQSSYQSFKFPPVVQDQFTIQSQQGTAQRYQTIPEKQQQNVEPEQSYDGTTYPQQTPSDEPDIYEKYLMSLSRLQKQRR